MKNLIIVLLTLVTLNSVAQRRSTELTDVRIPRTVSGYDFNSGDDLIIRHTKSVENGKTYYGVTITFRGLFESHPFETLAFVDKKSFEEFVGLLKLSLLEKSDKTSWNVDRFDDYYSMYKSGKYLALSIFTWDKCKTVDLNDILVEKLINQLENIEFNKG